MTSLYDVTRQHDRWADFGRWLTTWLAWLRPLRPFLTSALANWTSDIRSDTDGDADNHERRLEATEAALAAKIRSITLTSHDLRTPLNGILGMAGLLGRTSLSPEQANYVQAINTSASALLLLVDDMLDASKIAAGRWQFRPQPVALEELVEEVIELLAPRAQAKGIELAAHVSLQVPDVVSADPDQLTRILMNLTGNAVKFTDHGGVAIEVTAEPKTETAVILVIRIRDSGIGIASEDQSRIFGEYEQASGGSAPKANGTGLGLAISRDIARAMGGDITLESTPGKGSTFCLYITVPILQLAITHDRPLSGKHVLLVSDRIIEPPLLMRRLFDFGASVELARTMPAAQTLLTTGRRIDAILFDHGAHLDADEFRARAPGQLPPIAVMIAPAERDALPHLRASGIEAHLVKPMRTGSLIKVISAMLSGEIITNAPRDVVPVDPVNQAGTLKILLADDNEINLLLGKSVLQSLGQTVELVNNGALAVARATEAARLGQPFDVILMDLHMPVLDGFAAITAIRASARAGKPRPFIVALTADTTEESSIRAIEFGADITLTKPFQHSNLAEILDHRQASASSRVQA